MDNAKPVYSREGKKMMEPTGSGKTYRFLSVTEVHNRGRVEFEN
jgi:hypothetical protein